MKHVPENGVEPETRTGMDRLIRWCLWTFLLSTAGVAFIAWYAVHTDRVAIYLNMAGVVYLILCIAFLSIISIVFVQGHVGSSKEIEAPKLELFELEKRR
ncbi:MAG TPA: hypothetical protein VK968_17850 [Roseimicrobium sp.]|nr:hypothetical protein [Roseimicrobium sp.]